MSRTLRWAIGIAVVVVLLLGLALGAFWYVLHFSPDRTKYPVRGIDVSHHQGRIDWTRVAADDVAFAMIKATEGGDHVDDSFAANFSGARAAGLVVGAYHFFTFCKPGAEQAKNFIAAVPHDGPMLPPVIDIEFSGNCGRRPAMAEFAAELSAFIVPVEQAFGRPVVIYIIGDALTAYGAAVPERQRWVRSLAWQPGDGNWVLWQYGNKGRVAGIGADVDLNVLQGDAGELRQLSGG